MPRGCAGALEVVVAVPVGGPGLFARQIAASAQLVDRRLELNGITPVFNGTRGTGLAGPRALEAVRDLCSAAELTRLILRFLATKTNPQELR